MNSVIECIESLAAKLERHRKEEIKEWPTRRIFIEPMLQALGWDVEEPHIVEGEYLTKDGKSVDYALKVDGKPVLFIEAKQLNDPLTDVKAITQIVNYANGAGVEWCVLTNGVEYKVYQSTRKVEALDKLLLAISIDPKGRKGMPVQHIAKLLSYLSPQSMVEGSLDKVGEEVFTTEKIRKALDKIFMDPPSPLVRLVRSVISDDTIKPAQVKKVLNQVWLKKMEVQIPSDQESSFSQEEAPEGIGKDTIVVPAQEDGFQRVFLRENRWYAIRLWKGIIPRIKYIAAYQVAPISAVTHWAPVKNIVMWQDSHKFVVNFAEPAKEIRHITLVPKGRVKAPQAPRYASFDRLKKARTLDELF